MQHNAVAVADAAVGEGLGELLDEHQAAAADRRCFQVLRHAWCRRLGRAEGGAVVLDRHLQVRAIQLNGGDDGERGGCQ
jgi:hypothetical protein